MALRVDFNAPIDGGSGRIDLMRVLASSAQVANDFDPAVIFSSNFLSAQIEEFTATVSAMTAGSSTSASGSFTLARKYKTFPIIFGCYQQTNGTIIHPYFYNQYFVELNANGSGETDYTLERQECFCVDTFATGNNNYRIDWLVYNFGSDSALTNGTVRVRVVGEGI